MLSRLDERALVAKDIVISCIRNEVDYFLSLLNMKQNIAEKSL